MTIDVQISEREREILRLVATGATNQQIAHQLNISTNTVKVHLRNIFGKIGVASRTEASVYAIRQGLISGHAAQLAPEPPPTADVLLADVLPEPPTADAPPTALSAAVPPEPLTADHRPPTEAALPAAVLSAAPPTAEITPVVRERPTDAAPHAAGGGRRTALLVGLAAVCLALALALAYALTRPVPGAPPTPTSAAVPSVASVSRWKSHAPLAQPRSEFGVVAYDGRLYIIGGAVAGGPSAAVERYDPTSDQSAALTEKPTAASRIQASAFGGRIYVPGGEGKDGAPLTVFESYDPRTMQWEHLPPLPAPRSRYALANLDGRLYLFGGWDGTTCTADVLIYEPERKAWSTGEPLPAPRCDAGAAVVEGRISLIGGEGGAGALRANDRYDPTAQPGRQWETGLLLLPAAIAAPAVVEFARTIFVFDPQGRSVAQYTPGTDTWSVATVPPEIALSGRAAAQSASIFTFGSPAAVGEYRISFNTFLPNVSSSDK